MCLLEIKLVAIQMKTKFLSIVITALLLTCCSKSEDLKPCVQNCGKLVTKFHDRPVKKIYITYISDCNVTKIDTLNLTPEQLSSDNGIDFFINGFDLGEYYCE